MSRSFSSQDTNSYIINTAMVLDERLHEDYASTWMARRMLISSPIKIKAFVHNFLCDEAWVATASCCAHASPVPHVGLMFRTWAGLLIRITG